MTLDDWAHELAEELREAGYTVTLHQGFPLVTDKPSSMPWDKGVALIKWTSPSGLPCAKRIYAEGMLFTPGERSAAAAYALAENIERE